MISKSVIRDELLQARLGLSRTELASKSSLIARKLVDLVNWAEITSVHYYEPLARLNEIDVNPVVDFLVTSQPQIILYTSRKIDGQWQVVTRNGKQAQDVPEFDVIIIPMLGFDENLHRIGYGGGYYDRFLATQPTAQKIGISLEQGKIDNLPVEPHDMALDTIVTEQQVY